MKNVPLRVVFSTLFTMLDNVVKHGPSCLIYYVKATRKNASNDISNESWRRQLTCIPMTAYMKNISMIRSVT